MRDLSVTQRNCLRYATYNKVGDNYYCCADDTYRSATINALTDRGYLEDKPSPFHKRFLTEKGEAVRRTLISSGEVVAP